MSRHIPGQIVMIDSVDVFDSLRHGKLPNYLVYDDKGADYWANIVHGWSQQRGGVHNELELLGQEIDQLLRHLNLSRNLTGIYDFGCGTGEPAIVVMDALARKGVSTKIYVAIDTSDSMAMRAVETVSKWRGDISAIKMIANFTSPIGRPVHYNLDDVGGVMALFLGNTIANYKNPSNVLSNIRNLLAPDDYVLIGASLMPDSIGKAADLVSSYDNEHERKLLTGNLGKLGFECEDVEFWWDSDGRAVVASGLLSRAVKMVCGNRYHEFLVGDKLELLRSTRYTLGQLEALLSAAGMLEVGHVDASDLGGDSILILAQGQGSRAGSWA